MLSEDLLNCSNIYLVTHFLFQGGERAANVKESGPVRAFHLSLICNHKNFKR